MQTYIVAVKSKPGHEKSVAQFYQSLGPLLASAQGFRSRKIHQAQNGTMAEGVGKLYTAEELARHAEPPHEDQGTQFIVVETWDSVEERLLFSKNVQGGRTKDLLPHLLPEHSHEFYEDITEI